LISMVLWQTAIQPDATETMVVLFGCLIFTLLLVVYIFAPGRIESSEEKTRVGYLYERKDVIYENLRDLSFEYKAGKLSESDFQGLRGSMEEEAADTLAEIDQLERAAAPTGRATAPRSGNSGAGA
jgi:hypothetical protein